MPKNALQSAVAFGIILPCLQNQPPSLRTRIIYQWRRTRLLRVFLCVAQHAPQERLARPSMVACSGKGFALCCFPLMTVSQPVTRYRPSLRTLAVTSNQFFSGVTQMYQFIFAGIRRTDLTNRIQKIRITADNEHTARKAFAKEFILILAGKINLKNTVKNNRTLGGIYA